jgi:hypothetical protein
MSWWLALKRSGSAHLKPTLEHASAAERALGYWLACGKGVAEGETKREQRLCTIALVHFTAFVKT